MSARSSQGLRGFVEAWPCSLAPLPDRPPIQLAPGLLLSAQPACLEIKSSFTAVAPFMHCLFASPAFVNLLFAAAPTLVTVAFSY